VRQVRICGTAGQGIVMSGKILSEAAVFEKKFASQTTGYGSAMRGGIVSSDVILSDAFIDFPMITEIDLLVSMSEKAHHDSLPLVKKNGIIIVDEVLVKSSPGSLINYYSIPATERAIEVLKSEMVANIILLAATNSIAQLVSTFSLEKSIKSAVPPRFIELNLRALQVGLSISENLIAKKES
jgi:2-oxoglutarate ferredoxin oxidoreductase subunit gamma